MPRFHFTLASDAGSTDIGSIELPHPRAALPAGLKLTMDVLAKAAAQHGTEGEWSVEVSDAAGAALLRFKVGLPRATGAIDRPAPLH